MTKKLSDETVREIVHEIRPEWTVLESAPITSGTDAVSFVTLETENGRIETVLKACTEVPPADFRPEPYLCSILERETTVPVPKIFDAIDDHNTLPAPFFLMERCEGVLADEAELTPRLREQMARAAGRFAGEYHAVGDFKRFGYIRLDYDCSTSRVGATVDGRTLAVADDAAESWRASLENVYIDWIDDLDNEFRDLRSDLEAFIEPRFDTLNQSFNPVLGHIDYKPWNVLIQPETGETTAVIDWGHASTMAPYYDLILTEEHLSNWEPLGSDRRERVRRALADGYAEVSSFKQDPQFRRRRELYLAVAHLQPLVWFSEWTSGASDEERRQWARKQRDFFEELL